MLSSSNKKRVASVLAATGLCASLMVGSSASADPAQYVALVGVGSDTTQDVLNGFAGRSLDRFFTPVVSSSATGVQQIISFDALGAGSLLGDCIVLKPGGGAFERPNGSGNGREALSRAIDVSPANRWGGAGCGLQDISGNVDFARSSSGPGTGTSTVLTFIPFGRDAVGFASYRANGAAVTSLTRAQINTAFTSGSVTVGGVKIIPCAIQDGSGTFSFWNTRHGATPAQEISSTAVCRGTGAGSQPLGRLQENNGVELKAAGDAVAALAGESGTQVIIGFSAGAFVAKGNGVALPAHPVGVTMGSITDDSLTGGGANLGNPVSGTAPNLTPSTTFFQSAIFGRDVYNVLPSTVVDASIPNALQSLFRGSGSAVCQATGTIQTFGFLPLTTGCGSITLRGPASAGTTN